jgi:DNA-binding SARP family transcriptional activator/TolB-like protein
MRCNLSPRHRGLVSIRITTLGGLRARADDGGEIEWLHGQRLRAALFVYLAVERQASRDTLVALFWPESDAEHARQALRQSLYQLRKAVGGKWLESRAQELRVSTDVRTDGEDLVATLERGDAESAASLYGGPFLDGVHLVDVHAWETWVDARRAQYARTFRKACRDWLDAKRAGGDLAGALEAAEWWVAREPSDDEAQHRLIEALADTGDRTGAIRQYEAYARLLEPDGLRPLDETEALVERLRAETVPLPSLSELPATADPASAEAAAVERAGTTPVSHRTRVSRRSRVLFAAAITIAVIFAAARAVEHRRSVAPPPEASAAIAVLPFVVHGDDDARYLGDGMVNLLATALDGAASVRPVDTRAVHAAVAATGELQADREACGRVAARLGAGMYVLGDVVQAGDRLQIEAAVYDRDRPEAPRARAAVSGGAGELFELVDQLAARLLSGLGDASSDRLLRVAAVTTPSLPAFKAYIEGEARMRAGELERAADA